MFGTLVTLRDLQLDILAVTFSYGHRDSHISLDVRFLGDVIAWLIENPARFDQPIPRNWRRQRDALYLANFFQKEKIEQLHRAQEQDAPTDAWIKFNLYRSSAQNKQGTQALEKLAKAAALDPLFALEYLALSELAYEREQPGEALRMLGLAAEALPADPFITLQRSQLANELGDKPMALRLVEQLRTLEWSTFYFAQMPKYLEGLAQYIRDGEDASPAVQPLQTERAPSRILHSR
jgi:tetratricopeptide (TPR) repeat protein